MYEIGYAPVEMPYTGVVFVEYFCDRRGRFAFLCGQESTKEVSRGGNLRTKCGVHSARWVGGTHFSWIRLERHIGRRYPPTHSTVRTDFMFNVMDVVPSDHHHFSYYLWLTHHFSLLRRAAMVILKTPVEISKVQCERFFTNIGTSARQIQPLGERTIQENSRMAFFRAEDSLRLYLFSRFLL